MLSEVLERHLREIQEQQKRVVQVAAPVAPIVSTPQPTMKFPPTAPQLKFFHALVEGKQLTDAQKAQLLSSLPSLDKRAITSTIQWLIGLPWKPRVWVPRSVPKPNLPPNMQGKIKQGYYAIVDPQDSVLKFFQVRVPEKGKWYGYTFLSQVSGDNKLSVRDKNERTRIFAEIAKNPLEALKRFGQEIGQCGHCRKQLTDAESRLFGIGPICRGKLGV